MNSKILLLILSLVPVFVLGLGLSKPQLFLDAEGLSVSVFWSFAGTLISYFGLVFSLFALLEVKSLSNRYFAKQRLPEIKKQFEKVAKRMTELGGEELVNIRTERFMGEIVALVNQTKKTKVNDFSNTTKVMLQHRSDLERLLRDEASLKTKANEVEAFWSLLNAVTQLADEIELQHAEDQARL